jgi:sulfatase maturation enzyme AslB (radical SAM superfamily)
MRQYDDSKMRALQFLITEDCNLDCVYCYEKSKSRDVLSTQFIMDKIYQEMLADNEYEELTIDFFGGEPLLEFDTIRDVVEWFHRMEWPSGKKAYRFTVTTNGTLLDEEKKKWFSRFSKVVTLCLSMDGTRDAHNKNRSNSYDAVIRNIDFYIKHWPLQPVKMTVSQQTINQMYDGIVHIHELGLPVTPDIILDNVWKSGEEKTKALQAYAQQLNKLLYYYYRNPLLPRMGMMDRNILALYEAGDNVRKRTTYCGAGKHLTCWTANGEEYPCMRFSPLCTQKPIHDLESLRDGINEKCQKCVFEILCPTCEGHNYEVTGSCFNRTDFHCEFFQLEMLASAKLYFLENEKDLIGIDGNLLSIEDGVNRIRKILAILAINDICGKIVG